MNKYRAKKVLLIVAIIGICILSTGLTGRVVMKKITQKVLETDFAQQLIDSTTSSLENTIPGINDAINNQLGEMAVKLLVSVIKNDSDGFINTIIKFGKDIAKTIGSVESAFGLVDTSSLIDLAIPLVRGSLMESFQTAREQLVESTGTYMPLLVLAAYHSELLWAGGIITVAAILLWLLIGGNAQDIKRVKMPSAIGSVFIIFLTTLAIIAVSKMDYLMDDVQSSPEPTSEAITAETVTPTPASETITATPTSEALTVEQITSTPTDDAVMIDTEIPPQVTDFYIPQYNVYGL